MTKNYVQTAYRNNSFLIGPYVSNVNRGLRLTQYHERHLTQFSSSLDDLCCGVCAMGD